MKAVWLCEVINQRVKDPNDTQKDEGDSEKLRNLVTPALGREPKK